MAIQNTDLLIIERGGVQYNLTTGEFADFIGAVKDLTATSYSNMLAGTFIDGATPKVGDKVFIGDATGDPDVDAGYAGYRIKTLSPITVDKVYEQESMDITVTAQTDLSVTRNAAGVTVVSSTGTDAVIPLADNTNAGLMSPAAFNSVHDPASAGLTAATNPVVINSASQEVTFNITQLDPLP